jgi:alanyl-tRNA synthetase
MDTEQILRTFLDYFTERGHRHVTGTTLLPPPGDPVLFNTAGVHPLSGYLDGRPHPLGRRLVGVQRCLRTTDLEEVGDPFHLTVFEMLGSWSFGDYDGRQSIRWGYELLRDGFGLRPDLLHATVFGGDDRVGPDTGAGETWGELGVPVERCREDNWWSLGETGPCGPDSEIFAWTGDGPPSGTPGTDPRWVEVWNHVSMRYRRHPDGSLTPLPQRTVDTGMGLERLVMVVQSVGSVYDGDLFEPWVRAIRGTWPLDERTLRTVCDHLRSSVVVVGDGVRPSNTGRGYVLRRLIRRVLTLLWRDDDTRTLYDLPGEPIDHTVRHFRLTGPPVREVWRDEEHRFRDLLERGRRLLSGPRWQRTLDEHDLEYLRDTHGLPPDLVLLLRP